MEMKQFNELCSRWFPAIPNETRKEWFECMDRNSDGVIDFNEFKSGIMRKKSLSILKEYAEEYYSKVHSMKATLMNL